MATLALKPTFSIRPRSFHPKRDPRKERGRDLHAARWRAMSATTGAIALAFFCVAAPIVGDPAGRLFALDQVSTIPTQDLSFGDAWAALAFELTPNMLGPAITSEALMVAEEDAAFDEDMAVVMPVLEVHALPPIGAPEAASSG